MNTLNLLSIALTISSDRESLRYTYQKFESSNNIKILLTTQQIAWKQIEHEKKHCYLNYIANLSKNMPFVLQLLKRR